MSKVHQKMLKIFHVVHSLQVGGLENGLVNLINGLDPEYYQHEICCITSSGPMAARLERAVEIYELGKGDGMPAYWLPFQLAQLVRRSRPDLVHTRNWGTIDGILGARLAGVHRVVHGEHGRESTDPTGANRRRQQFRRWISPAVSRFVTVSDDLAQWLKKDVRVPARKVEQIINGVDTGKFRPPGDREGVKSRLGLPSGDLPLVGIVGRLDPVKGHETLIRSFVPLASAARLLIIGDGPIRSLLNKIVCDLKLEDSVYFLGARNDIPDLLRCLDLFVLPSVAEGISNTVLEAMATGLPVIASRVGGNTELVVHGKTGFLFDVGDCAALTKHMGNYLRNPGLRMEHAVAARQRAESDFSLKSMVTKYDELYRSLVR